MDPYECARTADNMQLIRWIDKLSGNVNSGDMHGEYSMCVFDLISSVCVCVCVCVCRGKVLYGCGCRVLFHVRAHCTLHQWIRDTLSLLSSLNPRYALSRSLSLLCFNSTP